jgi:cyclophilin family peptidyl-prolyl cis-trans isomerase
LHVATEPQLREEMRMTRLLAIALALAVPAFAKAAKKPAKETKSKDPVVVISTSMGDVEVQLDPKNAPISTENFLKYVKDKHYDGMVFHRVIKGFMIQGGGFDQQLKQKGATYPPIKNEAGNGLKNVSGTVAMARTNVVDSASDQFFINVKDNAFLDHRDETPRGFGYAVFGKVTKGMDVVKKIEMTPTQTKPSGDGVPLQDVPVETVVIKSVRLK